MNQALADASIIERQMAARNLSLNGRKSFLVSIKSGTYDRRLGNDKRDRALAI